MIFPIVMGFLGLMFLIAGAVEIVDPYFNRLIERWRR